MHKKLNFLSIILVLLFILITIIILFPIYYLIIASLQSSEEMFRSGMKLFFDPKIMDFNNYRLLITHRDGIYFIWFKNSVIIATLFTISSLFFSSLVGYGLGVYDFKFKNIIFTLVLVVMMIPLEILMLPLYKLMVQLKIINTYAGVILPFMVSPLAIFFFRQYSSGISKDFLDAGRIDGCTEFGIYFKIMMPLMIPAFGAMSILLAMQNWNSFVWPLIVLRTNEMFTLPLGISSLISPYGHNFDVMLPASVVAILPVVILFLFNQRFFIAGLTAGGVKG